MITLTAVNKNIDWGTPQKIADKVRYFFGGTIDLDPCSNDYSIVNAATNVSLPDNGLVVDWNTYASVFVNPPYGKGIIAWLRKCAMHDNCIALIPVATNTGHWKQYVYDKAGTVCFLHEPRLKFNVKGVPSKRGAPMACCLVYWGNDSKKFAEHFCDIGYCMSKTLQPERASAPCDIIA